MSNEQIDGSVGEGRKTKENLNVILDITFFFLVVLKTDEYILIGHLRLNVVPVTYL